MTAKTATAMAVPFRDRMIARARSEEAFALSLIAEAVQLMAEGHATEARSILRTLANAVGFEQLAKAMGKNAKSLHRQLSPSGNPTMNATSEILHHLAGQVVKAPVKITVHFEVAAA